MSAELAVQDHGASPVVNIPRMFLADEIGWLGNEARILRAFSGHEVWIDDPDMGAGPFRRLAYHPRLAAAVAEIASAAVAVESTTMLYARRGIVSPSAPYWRASGDEDAGSGPLAVVFLGDAWITVPEAGDGRFHRVEGVAGDVAVLVSNGRRLAAATEGHLAPLFLVQFGTGRRSFNGRRHAPPEFADDCLWQPAYWTAG